MLIAQWVNGLIDLILFDIINSFGVSDILNTVLSACYKCDIEQESDWILANSEYINSDRAALPTWYRQRILY